MLVPNNAANFNYLHQQKLEYGQGGSFYTINNDPGLVQFAIQSSTEVERLRYVIERMQNRSDAYSAVVQSGTGGTFVEDKLGRLVKLSDASIERACLIHRKSQGEDTCHFAIFTNPGGAAPLFLSEKDFFDDKKLINALQTHTHSAIRSCPTLKNSAALLRQEVAKLLTEVSIPRFAGWVKTGDVLTFLCLVVDGVSTSHQGENGLALPQHPDTSGRTMEVQVCAAEFFCRLFAGIGSNEALSILFLCYHWGMLSSLLPELDCLVYGALYIYCGNSQSLELVKDLFQSFRDAPLDLSQSADAFGRGLMERKDEAALIWDRRTTDCAARNCTTLQSAISTGAFDLRSYGTVPLQSFPVILSASITDLAASPSCLTVDLQADEICLPEVSEETDSAAGDSFAGYRLDFTQFTEDNLALLRQDLLKGRQRAFTEVTDDLSQSAAEQLGLLSGLADFVRRFYRSMDREALFDQMVPKNWLHSVPAPFIELSAKEDAGTDIAESFLATLRLNVTHLRRIYSRETFRLAYPPKKARVLFTDRDCLCVSSEKVSEICQSMRFSRTAVLAALSEAGLLQGRRVNNTTYLTRLTVKRFDGSSASLRVLKIPLSALETFGELSLLDGKEVL